MGTAGHEIAALGVLAAGEQHRCAFRVALDAAAGNAYLGDTSRVEFTRNAA